MDTNIDFEEWAHLAETDPEAFEQRRGKCIDQFLSGFGPHKRRLEGLQFKIDAERKLAHTPEKALVAISQMMSKSLNKLSEELKRLSDETKIPSSRKVAGPPNNLPSCEIINLVPKHDREIDQFHV